MFCSYDRFLSFFRPSIQSVRTIDKILMLMKEKGLSDQPSLVYILRHNLLPTLRWTLLPENLYSSGLYFFRYHQFYWDKIDPQQITIHNNFVTGHWNKIYRLKEMKLYPFDINGEYSDPTSRYLMIEWMQANGERGLELAVELANRLNRSLVVPRMSCSSLIDLKECNLCGSQPIQCYHSILKKAVLPWKEHVRLSMASYR